MTIRRFVGVTVGVLLGSVTLQMQAAQAQVPLPAYARSYKVHLSRAMDACVPANQITVVNPGSVGACPQANSDTDNTITGAIKATLAIRSGSKVFLALSGSGFTPPNQRLAVQLTLRTTNSAGSPAGSKTYADETVICGTTAGFTCGHYFPGDAFGKVHGRMPLDQCLTDNGLPTTLATGNIELLDVALINCDTGKVIAVPGLLKK